MIPRAGESLALPAGHSSAEMPAQPLTAGSLASYAAFGLPLAMMALPVYVLVPKFYSDAGLSLTVIGAVLLGTRLIDAVVDPWLGVWVDARRGASYLRPLLVALPLVVFGFMLLFLPPATISAGSKTLWLATTLTAAMLGYSLASIAYQSWGAGLADDDPGRARVTAWREAAGLIGVVIASVIPYALGVDVLLVVFALALAIAFALLMRGAPRPLHTPAATNSVNVGAIDAVKLPLQSPRFRWLLSVFVFNGIAAAIPASLVLFFIADRLELEPRAGVFLALYFVAGALSMGLWTRLAARWRLHAVWLAGMLASICAFIGAYWLGAGDFTGFALVCLLSGLALGADLALPPALLARVISADGRAGQSEGAYFGLWNLVNKLNLAMAAGIALPALALFGYTPGERTPAALDALSFSYAVLPCALKLVAAALLVTAMRGGKF